MVETAVLGCHFQIICFGLKVGLEVEWARLELGFISSIFLGIYSIARFFMTRENVSHCGSTTTGKPIFWAILLVCGIAGRWRSYIVKVAEVVFFLSFIN